MKKKSSISTADVTLDDGTVLTETDFERMAAEVEASTPDVARLQARRAGRPSLGGGPSPVLQIRLDAATRRLLDTRAAHDRQTPSAVARDAIKAWLNAS